MGALHLVVDRFSEIVQQTGPLGRGHIDAELRGHQACDMRHFDGVIQNILAIAGTILLAAQELDQLRMQAMHAGLKDGALALLLDDQIDLPPGFFHTVLDAGGVNPAVDNQFFQRNSRDFTADRIERGDRDGLRRIVDDEVDACDGLQRTDIAPLSTDDAPLHFVVGQGNHTDGGLRRVIRSASLNRSCNDLLGVLICLLLQLCLNLFDLHGSLHGGFQIPHFAADSFWRHPG